MHTDPHTELARQCVRKMLSGLGLGRLPSCGEDLLLRGGTVVGRRFRFIGVRAVWMLATGEIRLYDVSGELLGVAYLPGHVGRHAA